jgi:hypothetical protein
MKAAPLVRDLKAAPLVRDLKAAPLVRDLDDHLLFNLPDDAIVTGREACRLLRMRSPRSLELARKQGHGPPRIRLSQNRVRYLVGDLRAWVKGQRETPKNRRVIAAS